MCEFDIDEILLEANYKNKKGYINLKLTEDIKFLENVLHEKSYSTEFINEFINNLLIESDDNNPVKEKYKEYTSYLTKIINASIRDKNVAELLIDNISKLSFNEIKSIVTFRHRNASMNDFADFINANKHIENVFFYKGNYLNEQIGRGETVALICMKDCKKGGGQADLLINDGKYWEVKESVGKATFRSGAKSKPYISKLLRFLGMLNDWMTNAEYETTLNNLFKNNSIQFKDKNITDIWKQLAQQEPESGDINFSEIGIKKFSNVMDFIVQFRNAVLQIDKNLDNINDEEKKEILRIRGINKIFKVKSGTLDTLNKTSIGKDINVSMEPDISDEDENFIDIFSIIKRNPLLKGEQDNIELSKKIERSIKREFIEHYTGGLLFIHGTKKNDMSNFKYHAFNQSEFYENFSFAGITQGNVPKFKYIG